MQHSFDLVGQKRELEHVHRAAARLEVFLETGALKPALACRPSGGDPTLQPVRDAQRLDVLPRDISQRRKSLAGSPLQLAEELLNPSNHGRVVSREALGHGQAQVPAVPLVEKDFDAIARLARTDAPGQAAQCAFDVLARAEPVGPVVRATAGVDALADAANFHLVGIAVGRRDRVIAERANLLIRGSDFVDLGSTAPLSSLDLFFVRRMPALKGRSVRPVSTPRSSACTFPGHGCALPRKCSRSLHRRVGAKHSVRLPKRQAQSARTAQRQYRSRHARRRAQRHRRQDGNVGHAPNSPERPDVGAQHGSTR